MLNTNFDLPGHVGLQVLFDRLIIGRLLLLQVHVLSNVCHPLVLALQIIDWLSTATQSVTLRIIQLHPKTEKYTYIHH
jgi:hypothetical protein